MEQMLRALAAQMEVMSNRLSAIERAVGAGSVGRFPFPPVDPAPDGGPFGPWGGWPFPRPWPWPWPFPQPSPEPWPGPIFDPSPVDLGRLSRVQLESRLADIKHQRQKLDQLEALINEALAGMK